MKWGVVILGLLLVAADHGPEPSFRGRTAGEWADVIHRRVTGDRRNWPMSDWLAREFLGRKEEALPVALAMRRDPRVPVRAFVAAHVLGRMHSRAPTPIADPVTGAAVRALLEMLSDGSPDVRAATVRGLGMTAFFASFRAGPPDTEEPDETWPFLPPVVTPPGPLLRETHRRLREARGDPSESVRVAARETLQFYFGEPIAPPPAPALPELVADLTSRNRYHARQAVQSLGRLGDRAEPAVAALVRAGRGVDVDFTSMP